jgi:hypothetical protein
MESGQHKMSKANTIIHMMDHASRECVVTMTYEGETVVNKKNIGLGKDETKEQLILRLREILQNHINAKNSFIE